VPSPKSHDQPVGTFVLASLKFTSRPVSANVKSATGSDATEMEVVTGKEEPAEFDTVSDTT